MLHGLFKSFTKRSLRRWAAKVAGGIKRQAIRAERALLSATDKLVGPAAAAALCRPRWRTALTAPSRSTRTRTRTARRRRLPVDTPARFLGFKTKI